MNRVSSIDCDLEALKISAPIQEMPRVELETIQMFSALHGASCRERISERHISSAFLIGLLEHSGLKLDGDKRFKDFLNKLEALDAV